MDNIYGKEEGNMVGDRTGSGNFVKRQDVWQRGGQLL